MHERELFVAAREERLAAGAGGELLERLAPADGHAGRAVDPDGVERAVQPAHGFQRLFEPRRTLLVVSVGDEHDDVPAVERLEPFGGRDDRVGDRRAAFALQRFDRTRDGGEIGRRARHRTERCGERQDDHLIVRLHGAPHAAGDAAHEVEAIRHAVARVDEQRVRRRDERRVHQLDRLRLAVLVDGEVVARELAHIAPFLVEDGDVEEHARDARFIGDVECGQRHRVDADGEIAAHGFRANRDGREGILVGPLHGVDGAFAILADELIVDVEPHRVDFHLDGRLRSRADLGDDPHGTRRRDAALR